MGLLTKSLKRTKILIMYKNKDKIDGTNFFNHKYHASFYIYVNFHFTCNFNRVKHVESYFVLIFSRNRV